MLATLLTFLKTEWTSLLLIIVSILLMIVILIQQRGTSLGGAFGGGNNVYRSKRGIEKVLFIATIILVVLFIGFALINLFLKG